MTLHHITANRHARKAWQWLGKARETRRAASYETNDGIRELMLQSMRSQVLAARFTMHTAIMYREMEGRLMPIKPHETQGYSQYGAQMGRHTGPAPSTEGARWSLQRVRIDQGGYDPGGAYWEIGAPLYWANDSETDVYFRARNREAAKAHIRTEFDPLAKFYR